MTTCPACRRPIGPQDRWCGACGSLLADPDSAGTSDPAATPPATPPPPPDTSSVADRVTPRPATRRQVLRLAGVGIVGAGIGWFARGPGTPDWIDVGRVDALLARIEVEGWAPAPSADGDPAQAVVRWDPSVVRSDGLRSQIVYASEPVVDTTVGLMVLVLRSSQGGCATPFCPSSGLFEDACFGSRFNGWGEWMGGPAPRSLDRRPSRVVGGRLEVSRTGYTIGAARDFGVHAQEPAGPSCSEL